MSFAGVAGHGSHFLRVLSMANPRSQLIVHTLGKLVIELLVLNFNIVWKVSWAVIIFKKVLVRFQHAHN